jgi:hypothetical protein
MEKWSVYEKMGVKVHSITRFVGGECEVAIHFSDPKGDHYRLYFDDTLDFRYAIEEAFIATVYRMPEELRTPDPPSILMVADSAYLKHFEEEAGGTRPLEGLVHYLIIDSIDTGVELLSYTEPVLTKVDYDIYEETDRYITGSDQQDAA